MTDRPSAPPVTRTARLRLEPVGLEHAEDMAVLLGDPRVGAWLGGVRDAAWARWRTEQAARVWDEHGYGLWAAYDLHDGGFVGRGGLNLGTFEGEGLVEVGWSILPARWRQGYATEIGAAGLALAAELGLGRVWSWTLTANAASRGVMTRLGLGYVRDGVVTVDGTDLPHVLYATAA